MNKNAMDTEYAAMTEPQGGTQAKDQRRLRVEFLDVTKIFRQGDQEITAVKGMTFKIYDREFISIIGPSGCGKSTTLKLISGLDFPVAGTVRVDGQTVAGPSPRVGFMLQKDLLLPWRTILENVTIGLEMRGVGKNERADRARHLIHKYGLGGFEDSYPRHLSGGMRQRVALARTLAVDPDILLLDEPLSALDFQTKLKMEEELVRILQEEKKTVMLITHDIAEAVSVSDRVLVCSSRPGRIKAEFAMPFSKGHSPEEARSKPEFIQYFNTLWRELEADVKV
jgi:NitT/TauT family transport system ATP-binding protein